LKKRAAAWFTMRSWGLGVYPNKLLIFEDDIKNHCLPFFFGIIWHKKIYGL